MLGDSQRYDRSPAVGDVDGDLAADQMRSFSHSQQTERSRTRYLVIRDSSPIVAHGQYKTAVVVNYFYFDVRCIRVAQYVCHRFLYYAESDRGAIAVEFTTVGRT